MPKNKEKRTFKLQGKTIDIPSKNADKFLEKYPDAQELASYVVGKDTIDVPVENEAKLLQKYPDAKPTYAVKKKASSQDSNEPSQQPTQPSGENGEKINEIPAFSQEEQRQKDLTGQIDANLEKIGVAEQEPFSEGESENPPITSKAQLEGRMVMHIESLNQKTKKLQEKRSKLESFTEGIDDEVTSEKQKVSDYILPMPRKFGNQEFYTKLDQESVEEYNNRVEEFNGFLKKFNVDNAEEYEKLFNEYNGDAEELMTHAKTVERWYENNQELLEEDLESPLLSAFHSGSLKLISSIYRTPEFLWDLAANGYNLMLDAQDKLLPESAQTDGARVMTSQQIGEKTGITNVPAKNLENSAEVIDTVLEKYRQPIFESIQNGDYEGASYSTALSISESLPFTMSIFIPSAAGVSASRMFAGTTAAMGAQQKQELQGREDLTEEQKNANALIYGFAESFEVLLGQGNTGRVFREIIKREGKEGALNYGKRVIDDVIRESPALDPFREGLQEGMTTYTQNLADIYINGDEKSVNEGVADAVIVGSTMGSGSGTVSAIAKYNSNNKNKQAKAINMAALSSKIGENIRKNIQAKYEAGKITQQEMEVQMVELDRNLEAEVQIPEQIQGEKRTRALELQKEYDQTKRAKEKAGDAFKKPYAEKMAAIEEELSGLFEEAQTNERAPKKPDDTKTDESPVSEIKVFTSPTDQAYASMNLGEGKGSKTLTKAEYDAEIAKRESPEADVESLEVTEEELAELDKELEQAEESPIVKLQEKYNLTESESAEGVMVNEADSEVQLGFSETDKPNTVKLESIRTKEGQRGQGKAKEALDELTQFADENGITIELDVVPETDQTTQEGLTGLYEQAGFEATEGNQMVRTPQTKKETSSEQQTSGAETTQDQPKSVETATAEETTQKKETKEVTVSRKDRDINYDVDFDSEGKVLEIRTKKGKKLEPYTIRKSRRGNKTKVKNANYFKAYAAATEGLTDNQIKQEEDRKLRDALDSEVLGYDAYTLALINVAEGTKLQGKDVQRETGMQSENLKWITGFNKESDLPKIERAAEIIMENAPEGVEYDMQEVRNALIDIASTYTSIEEVRKDVIRIYEQTIDPYYGMDVDEMIEAEKQNMSPEKLSLYESVEAESSLTGQELENYYQEQYENSIENLPEQGQQRLYEEFYAEQRTDQNESDEQGSTQEGQAKQEVDAKEGVNLVFDNNSELSEIGTKKEYSDYLKTIFPDSKVKDIVYHGRRGKIDFNKSTDAGVYFTDDFNYAKEYSSGFSFEKSKGGASLTAAILNLDNPTKVDGINSSKVDFNRKKGSSSIMGKEEGGAGINTFVVFESNQAYVLGSKQDIEGFKQFKENQTTAQESQSKQEVDFEKEITVLKKLPSSKMQIKADAINKKIDRALKNKEITEEQASDLRNRVNSFAKDKFIQGLNDAIDDTGMMYSSIIPMPILKAGLIAVRETYIQVKNLSKAIQAGLVEIERQMKDKYTPEVEKEFKQTVNNWLKKGNERAKTPEGKRAIAFSNLQNIVEAVKGDAPNLQSNIKDFLKGLPEGTLSDFKAKKLAEKAAKVGNTDKDLDAFIKYAEKIFNEAAMRDFKRGVSKKLKNAGRGKGKSNIGQYAKAFSKTNLSGIEDIDLLQRIKDMAEDLASSTPKSSVSDINSLVEEIENSRQEVEQTNKSLDQRIKDYKKRRDNISSPTTFVNAEIERQKLLSEVASSEEMVDQNLIDELEEESVSPEMNDEISSAEIASKTAGNIKRAKTAITKAFKNGDISEGTKQRLEDEVETAVQTFNNQMEVLLENEKSKAKESRGRIKRGKNRFNKVQRDEIDLILGATPVESVAWLNRFNEVAESIASGNLPVQEITSLREYSAYKSEQSSLLADSINTIKERGRSLADWVKRLGTKEIGQRARNILQSQDETINQVVYSPLARALDSSRKLSTSILGDYINVAKKPLLGSNKKRSVMAGMIGHYMREASMAGKGITADGVEVGARDIFGILLGKETALNAAGFDEKTKKFFKDGQAISNYADKKDRKLIREIYEELPKTNGIVDPSKIDQSVLDARGQRMFNSLMDVFDRGVELQEVSNLRKGKEFQRQLFYFPTWRQGRIVDAEKPMADNDKFSIQAKSGQEKITESLRPKIGSYMVEINQMAAKYADEVALDYTFSKHQPIQNALMNSAISQTGDKTIGRAIKMDYNASLDFEKSIGNTSKILTNLFGARYFASLFDPIRSTVEIIAASASIPLKARSLRGLVDMGSSESWSTLKKIEEDFGVEIATFQSADIERQGIRKGGKRQNFFVKAGRMTMGAPEYFTAIAAFMPEFRRTFRNETGDNFNPKEFKESSDYAKENKEAIEKAISKGQQLVYRIYGGKSKGASRRGVEILPSWLNMKGSSPVTVQADTNIGRVVSFFGNFAYREQGEFFQSLSFFMKDLGKGRFNSTELSNASGILSNAMTYAYGMGTYYLMEMLLMGDEDEQEQASAELDAMYSIEGATELMSNQLAFLSVGKYGKVSRNGAIGVLSGLYWQLKRSGMEEEAGRVREMLQDNFYIYQPIDITNNFTSSMYATKEFAPAMYHTYDLVSKTAKSGMKLTKEDKEDIVYLDFLFNATNLSLAIGSGTQLPMSKQFGRQLKRMKKDAKKNKKSNSSSTVPIGVIDATN